MKKSQAILEKIIWRETQLLVEEVSRTFPDLFTHMVLAIYKKKGGGEQGFLYAIEAALSFLIQNDYITPDSDLLNVSLTSKGQAQNVRHAREPMQKGDSFYSLLDYFDIDENS